MSEYITEHDSTEMQTVVGDFTLHMPKSSRLVPQMIPETGVHLGSREYEHDTSSVLAQSELSMLNDREPGRAIIVGTIDFETPPGYFSSIRPMIGTKLEKQLCATMRENPNASDQRVIRLTRKGIETRHPFTPTTLTRISEPGEAMCRLEISAIVDRKRSERSLFYQLIDIRSVAEQWVELQDIIHKLGEKKYRSSSVDRHIYLDFDNDSRVSEVEFALAEVMASYNIESIPRWDSDIDSRVLSDFGNAALNTTARHDMSHELIVNMRQFHDVTGYMQPLTQGAIINALANSSKKRNKQR